MNEKLKQARERLNELVVALRAAADAYEQLPDTATAEERDAASASFDEARAAVDAQREEVSRLERIEEARAANPAPDAPAPALQVTREPETYSRHNTRDSYFLDLARRTAGKGMSDDVAKRLERHGKEIADEISRRESAAARGLDAELDEMANELLRKLPLAQAMRISRAIEQVGLVERRDLSRIDGSGGDFVPPLWMLDEYAALARAARPFADEVRKLPLPAGTDSVSIPRITTGTLTGFQTQDNQTLAEQDIQTAMVRADVRTIGGIQDVALQLLEQSPIAFDQLIFEDLFADMDQRIDIACVSGDGGPGNFLGILNVTGVNAITYTDGTPTVPELYPKLADALNQAADSRKRVPTHFWWATRRWFWAAKELDTTNRPFFIASSNGPLNTYGIYDENVVEGGPVTNAIAVPVRVDNNMPTNLGGGSNEDRIVATRMQDHVLMEGSPRAEAFREVLSNQVAVRLRVYKYAAFTAGRFPAGTSVISGTGLATPTF